MLTELSIHSVTAAMISVPFSLKVGLTRRKDGQTMLIVSYKAKGKVTPLTGPVVAHSGSRGMALLFHDLGTRRG